MNLGRRSTPLPLLSWSLLLLLAPVTAACGGSTGSPDVGKGDASPDVGELLLDLDAGKDATNADQSAPVEASASTDAGTDAASGLTAVPLVSCVPSEYLASVSIGGTQTFRLAIDTGSTTLGVASSKCTDCAVSPEYTPGTSATDENKTADSQYGTGDWSGEIYQDTVRAGSGPSAPDTLVAIDSQSQFFQPGVRCGTGAGPDGILGLGPTGAALAGTQGFFDALVSDAHVPDIFATELCDGSGTLWLGGYDPSFTTAAPQYTPLVPGVDAYYYAVTLTSITVAGTSVPVASGQYTDSIVDTGTSVFILPTSAYDTVTTTIGANAAFRQIFGFGGPGPVDASAGDGSTAEGGMADAAVDSGNGASWFANPENCVALSQTKAELDAMLPPLTLVFGSNPPVSVQAAPTESYLVSYEGEWCPALYAMTPGPSFPLASIMGSPVLRSNVVIFDRANSRIGFAPHTPCP
jgi:hypothetical protein